MVRPDTAETMVDRDLCHVVNFGWNYIWHCHILAHEENDMMHALAMERGRGEVIGEK